MLTKTDRDSGSLEKCMAECTRGVPFVLMQQVESRFWRQAFQAEDNPKEHVAYGGTDCRKTSLQGDP